ncbi:intracellular coagulation inhibitor 1-like [Ornithodoros turicata]|uniref:intracellular coagulation inhibitor 1-like n=1 Tax=Ornithodoros turicata TaxID=34597 RepID=UPI003139F58E
MLIITFICAFVLAGASPPEVLSLAEANNYFAVNLLKSIPTQAGNVFVSPLSVSIAMAMLHHGARGVSQEELAQALGYKAAGLQDRGAVLSAMGGVLRAFGHREEDVTLNVANSVLLQRGHPALPEYKKDIEVVFQALFDEVDFTNHSQLARINDWVSNQTRGKINDFLTELSPNAVMVILNAVYFKGTWETQFNKTLTKKTAFYNHGVTKTVVDMMRQAGAFRFSSSTELNSDIVELPYKGHQLSMIILLPRVPNGLPAVLEALDAHSLQNALDGLISWKVDVKLPKFKLESGYSLVEYMKKLGAESIFDESKADLTGISPGLVVSEVMHKAVVEVNEEGSEASGATMVSVTRSAVMTFKVNHPFLFFIRDVGTNMILFMGVVNKL